ncbi:MAG: folylpolyglutamate synthase/dihydrofolate synthase family protein [Verrucomicrobiales bacterium]|nr:folylpolyglutamate synthase/dihydrofolate synthase family protein [Verrucomicrobiales bacterium]
MTYTEAVKFLYRLRWLGAKFGLENTRRLAALAGRPHERLRFIHVAGTNGKGSTCAMLESIYRAAGLRVGLYTSPHLVSFRERIQVNRQLIPEADVVRLVGAMQPWLATFPAEHQPTFFEVVTVMALRYFEEQRCDLVVWETGMGGRLDATNIVTPLASVITNIGFDHQQWLGNTLAQIAAEKAGIIKPGVPVLTATDAPEALEVIERTARERGAPLTVIGPETLLPPELASLQLPLPGAHQRRNAALAIATVQALQEQIPVSREAVVRGLSTVQWPGRMQTVTRPGGQRVVLDAAHNPAGIEALAGALRTAYPGARFALVLGILRDKDWRAMCERLAPLARRILTVPVGSERTADAAELAEACRHAAPGVEVCCCASLDEALERVAEERLVVVTGSSYLVGEVLERLGLAPEGARQERALNEWAAAPSQPLALPAKP